MSAVAIGLSVVGGLFEMSGLVIVIQGIAADRAQARRLLDPPPTTSPGRAYPLPPAHGPFSPTSVTPAEVARALLKLKRLMDTDLGCAVMRLRQEAEGRDRDLRDGLRYVLVGDVRGRAFGAALLGLGIALSTAGSVVGTLA
jgi:hypothetical protein